VITRTKTGDPLITTEDAADFLRVTETSEHPLIELLVEAATLYCESFTSRDVRANEYELLCDDFPPSEIELLVSNVVAVSEVARLVSGVFTAFAEATNWYVVSGLYASWIELESAATWPSDADTRRENVRIRFATAAHKDTALCSQGILRHVAAMYADRGDAEVPRIESGGFAFAQTLSLNTARQSGAEAMYAPIALAGI
jgi:hypothetical protein